MSYLYTLQYLQYYSTDLVRRRGRHSTYPTLLHVRRVPIYLLTCFLRPFAQPLPHRISTVLTYPHSSRPHSPQRPPTVTHPPLDPLDPSLFRKPLTSSCLPACLLSACLPTYICHVPCGKHIPYPAFPPLLPLPLPLPPPPPGTGPRLGKQGRPNYSMYTYIPTYIHTHTYVNLPTPGRVGYGCVKTV